jgi:hypothetical protein
MAMSLKQSNACAVIIGLSEQFHCSSPITVVGSNSLFYYFQTKKIYSRDG